MANKKIVCYYCGKDITNDQVSYFRNLKDDSLLVCEGCYKKKKLEG